MKYDEFRIEILPGEGMSLRARVGHAAGIPSEHHFDLPPPPTQDELSDRSQSDTAGQLGKDGKTELGRRLFKAGFGEEGARSFRKHQAGLAARQADAEDVGMRVRLLLGEAGTPGSSTETLVRVAEVLPAAGQPWEAMVDPDEDRFFALSRYHSVVRTVGSPQGIRPMRVKGAINVLVVDAAPPALDAEAEIEHIRKKIKDTLVNRHTISVKVLPDASWEETCRELRADKYHILHFIGHGRFDHASGVGRLIFEARDGSEQPIDAHQLWMELYDVKTLRLVFLNSCWSAKLPSSTGQDPMGSVALALSAAGVPAVLGMQIPVYDDSAVVFAREFYGTLREGVPIEAAVAEGRKAIAGISPEWATPVLHLRGETSEIFEVAAAVAVPRDGERRLRLGVRSFVKSPRRPDVEIWAQNMKETTDRLLPLEEFFDGRFIARPEAWSEEVLPRLNEFLRDAVRPQLPLLFDFAAHGTLAFAAGYFIHAKGGLPTAVIQRGVDSTETWLRDEGPLPPGRLWQEPVQETLDPSADDLALVLEISNPAAAKVRAYLQEKQIPIRRLVRFSITGEPGSAQVASGLHAFGLAQKVSNWVLAQPGESPERKLHLFWSAPNTFAFFLGRLAQGFGRVQLYEFDFEKQRHGSYEPSLELPLTLSQD